MSLSYVYDPESGILRTRCTGSVTLEETLAHFEQVMSDPGVPAGCKALLDVSRLEALPETRQLRSAADALDQLPKPPRSQPWAIVAGRDAVYGLSRMFQVFLEQAGIASRVFRTEEEAEHWLETLEAPHDGPSAPGG